MTSMINRRAQFEEGVVTLKKEVVVMEERVSDQEVEITRLNTELDGQRPPLRKQGKLSM